MQRKRRRKEERKKKKKKRRRRGKETGKDGRCEIADGSMYRAQLKEQRGTRATRNDP